jgi:hypothetical protein
MKVVIPKGGSHEDWSNAVIENKTFFRASSSGNSLKLWHERFGHLHLEMILKMSWEKMVINMKLSDKEQKKLCEGCVYGKSHQLPYLKSDKTSKAKKAWEFFHSNVYGPMNIQSLGNARYFLLVIDDFNRFRFVFWDHHFWSF